jgi:hypothetical protein
LYFAANRPRAAGSKRCPRFIAAVTRTWLPVPTLQSFAMASLEKQRKFCGFGIKDNDVDEHL